MLGSAWTTSVFAWLSADRENLYVRGVGIKKRAWMGSQRSLTRGGRAKRKRHSPTRTTRRARGGLTRRRKHKDSSEWKGCRGWC